jgi:hypothetical protein
LFENTPSDLAVTIGRIILDKHEFVGLPLLTFVFSDHYFAFTPLSKERE